MQKYSLMYMIQSNLVELGDLDLSFAQDFRLYLLNQGIKLPIDIIQQ